MILEILRGHYPLAFDSVQFIRDSGSVAYTVYAGSQRYFLRITKPAFFDSVQKAVDIHVFLQRRGVFVPPVIFTNSGAPYVLVNLEDGAHLFILYDFVEGEEVDPEEDAEEIGALVGKLHRVMKSYPVPLVRRGKQFYIGRYLDIMRRKQYPLADAFAAYGEALWDQLKDLPRGYCHGDLYRGNILKTGDKRLCLLDFDTSCEGFPMYDPVLICNMADFFTYKEADFFRCRSVFQRFLPQYQRHRAFTPEETAAFFRLNALYHFALQATIIEIYGLDCVDNAFLDNQLDLLTKWRDQCRANQSW